MSGCTHPQVAQVFDRIRGTMTCSYCGEVVSDQQYEIDPAFNRGDKPTGGRPPPGFARPMRSTMLSNPGTHRPSIENARRSMSAIARQLEISQDDVEKAVAIFKLAVNNNAIGGSRPSTLCACLYAICRRANTPHTIFDFADATKETPYSILSYLKLICRATNTQLPPPDPTFYVHRLAQLLNLGDQTEEITILAVKILRAMNAEWLGYGRRPLGLCGAAVLVAANAFGVQRHVNDVVNFVRLSPDTIFLRMSEFLKTDAASLIDIDEYKPSNTALPPALMRKQSHDWVQESSDRHLAQLYYSLLNEAKQSEPATPERAARWEEFIRLHCKLHNLDLVEDVMNLNNLTPEDQLAVLGVKDVTPSTAEAVSDLKEIESTRLIVSAAMAALGDDKATKGKEESAAGGGSHNAASPSMVRNASTRAIASSASMPAAAGFSGEFEAASAAPSGIGGEYNISSFDSMWGAMGGSASGGGDGFSSGAGFGPSSYGGEEEDEFAFGGGSGGGYASGGFGGGGGNDFGFGDEYGFDAPATASKGAAPGKGINDSDLRTDAKSEAKLEREGLGTQVSTVHSMMKRFDQLRALNNDVTTHVANVVQKAQFEYIVLPPVHKDLGFLDPFAASQLQQTASTSRASSLVPTQMYFGGTEANDAMASVPITNAVDPFASIDTAKNSDGHETVNVKHEPCNSQQLDQIAEVGASAQSATRSSVVKISSLLSTKKDITSVEAGIEAERQAEEAYEDTPLAVLASNAKNGVDVECDGDENRKKKRLRVRKETPSGANASGENPSACPRQLGDGEEDPFAFAAPVGNNASTANDKLSSDDEEDETDECQTQKHVVPAPSSVVAPNPTQPSAPSASSNPVVTNSLMAGSMALLPQLAPDLQVYIIQDLEVRLRLEAAGKRVFGDKWDAGAAKGDDEVLQAELRACIAHGVDKVQVGADGSIFGADGSTAPVAVQRKRTKIRKHESAAQAIKESLRNKGASQIDVSALFGDEGGGTTGDFDATNGDMSDGEDGGGGGWDE